MITINVETKAVHGSREHEPQVFSYHFGKMNITPGYIRGWSPARYPVPSTIRYIEPLCFFCGSINGECSRAPQDCLDNQYRGYGGNDD